MIYTHEMLENYINNNFATDEAYNYVDAGMSDKEIRTDVENCLSEYEFERTEDREAYINLILSAASDIRKEQQHDG